MLTVWSYCQGSHAMTLFQKSRRSTRFPAMGDVMIGTDSRPGIEVSVPQDGNRPELPLRLQMPQKCAGILTLPAMSVPISILLPPQARRAPPPPVDAPTVKSGLYGLSVRPNTSDAVSIASKPAGTVVFTWTSAPASCKRRTIADEVAAGFPTFLE